MTLLVYIYCAELKIPNFIRGKTQLEKHAIDGMRDLASIRIHVERDNGLLCNKFYSFTENVTD